MPDELPAPAAQVAPPAPAPAPVATPPAPAAETFSREYVEQLRQEAASHRTKLKKLEDAQAAADTARLQEAGEFKTLAEQRAARIAELERAVQERDHAALVARIAAKHALPGPLADRLRGTTEEELEADAKALATLIPPAAPPPAPPPAPTGAPTNPARPPSGDAQPAYTFSNLPTWGTILGQPAKA